MMLPATISPLERAIQVAGSQAELARRLGTTQARIWNWLNRDKQVPAEVAIPIEAATAGEVTRHDLRPDLFGPNPPKAVA